MKTGLKKITIKQVSRNGPVNVAGERCYYRGSIENGIDSKVKLVQLDRFVKDQDQAQAQAQAQAKAQAQAQDN